MGIGVGSVTLPGEFENCGLTIDEYSEEPYIGNTAELPDEYGDIVDTERFGEDAGIAVCEAVLIADCGTNSIPQSVTLGGEDGIESVVVDTSNSDFPKITVRWYSGLSGCDAGATYTADLSGLVGEKKAQALGGLNKASGYIQSSSLSYSCQFSPLWGVQVNLGVTTVSLKGYAFTGGRAECSIDIAGGAVSSTLGTGWKFSSGPVGGKTREGFPTANATATKTLARNSSSATILPNT